MHLSNRVATRAWFLIFLLAGAEAKRVADVTQTGISTQVLGPESDWTTENDKCTWHISELGCGPSKSAVSPGSCQKRCMPMDITWSSCCRLSDDYMLANDRTKYFKLASGVLAAKAEKFKRDCKALHFWQLHTGRRCQRRATHLLRSIEFMSKAQDDALISSMSFDERSTQKRSFDASLNTMAEAIGEEGPIIMKLQQKMKSNKAGVRADPQGTITKIMSLVQAILKGTPEEKQEAIDEIEAMPDSTDEATGAEKEEQDRRLNSIAASIDMERTQTAELIDATNYLDTGDLEEDVVSSLVERDTATPVALIQNSLQTVGSEGLIAAVGLVVIVVLIVCAVLWAIAGIITAIVSWAFLSILGCGLYSAGHNAALSANKEQGGSVVAKYRGVGDTLKCIAKVFAAPFIFIGTAVYATYKFFSGNDKEDGDSLLELSVTRAMLVKLSTASKRARKLLIMAPMQNTTY